jgi:hypothetical protein
LTGEGWGASFRAPGGGRGGGPSDASVTRGGGVWRGRLPRPAGNGGRGLGGVEHGSREGVGERGPVAFARPKRTIYFVNYSKIFK